jgi:hypothetical protein
MHEQQYSKASCDAPPSPFVPFLFGTVEDAMLFSTLSTLHPSVLLIIIRAISFVFFVATIPLSSPLFRVVPVFSDGDFDALFGELSTQGGRLYDPREFLGAEDFEGVAECRGQARGLLEEFAVRHVWDASSGLVFRQDKFGQVEKVHL